MEGEPPGAARLAKDSPPTVGVNVWTGLVVPDPFLHVDDNAA